MHQFKIVRQRLKFINNFGIYYGIGQLDKLKNFDLLIVQPETFDQSERKNATPLLVAYLSLGEVETHRSWYVDGRYVSEWTIALNSNWGSYSIDVCQEGWQQLVVSVAESYIAQGFHGLFLDTVDTAITFPYLRPCMINVIRRLREIFPENIIIQNRGFDLIDETHLFIDAVLYESLSTTYDFSNQQYSLTENRAYVDLLQQYKLSFGLTLLSLDYAEPNNLNAIQHAACRAREAGFIPALSTIFLNNLPYDIS